MPILAVVIIIVGTVAAAITFFTIKTITAPKKITELKKLLEQGNTGTVIKSTRALIAKDPKNTEAHYLLGQAYLKEKKPELALMEYKTVDRIGRFSMICPEREFRRGIAELFERYRQPEEALKEYLILLKMEPENARFYSKAGELFEMRDRGDKAEGFYRKAIELDSRLGTAHFRLGRLLYNLKRTGEARQELEKAVSLNPNLYQAWFFIGRLLKQNKDFAGALTAFEKAQKDPEQKIRAIIERGTCYMNLKNIDSAEAEFQRAVKLSKDDSQQEILFARYFLAMCFEMAKDIEKAIDQWEIIYSANATFKDVATKLSQYQDLRHDDTLKDFLTASMPEFHEICSAVVKSMGMNIREIKNSTGGCQIIAIDAEQKWERAKRLPRLIRFLRVMDPIPESIVRSLHEEMKSLSVNLGMIIASSSFSKKASEFAGSRPIDLYNKDKLQVMLKKIRY